MENAKNDEHYLAELDEVIREWEKADDLEDDDVWEFAEIEMCNLTVGNIANETFKIDSKELVERCKRVLEEYKKMIDEGEESDDFEYGNWLGILEDIDSGRYDVPELLKTMSKKILALWEIR